MGLGFDAGVLSELGEPIPMLRNALWAGALVGHGPQEVFINDEYSLATNLDCSPLS